MTVRVSRTVDIEAPVDAVWEFIANPENRASAISVVEDYEVHGADNRQVTWTVRLPIPLISATITVETEDVTRDPPHYVEFVGRSRAFNVRGKHSLEATDGGCRLTNEFVVDGKLPGVERFFDRNFESELNNLEQALRRDLERPPEENP